MSGFSIHPRLVQDCHILGRLGTSHLLLHRNAAVPWFILVPETDAGELCDLEGAPREALRDETDELARFVRRFFGAARTNVAAIGNLVPQLHVHVIGRSPGDPCWPRPVWGHLDTVAVWGAARLGEVVAALGSGTTWTPSPFGVRRGWARWSRPSAPGPGSPRTCSRRSRVVVAGVDGCRAGWFVVARLRPHGQLAWRVTRDFRGVVDWLSDEAVIGVDIPVGLPESGPRACDRLARARLGPRRASLFPAPVRPVMDARDYQEACALRERIDGRRMSRQAWNLVPKIRQVDELVRSGSGRTARIVEVHPELSFREMACDGPMRRPKRSAEGRAERLALLETVFGEAPGRALAWCRGRGCAPDDVLDGFAVLWSALRVRAGRARCLPDPPESYPHSLPMAIFA